MPRSEWSAIEHQRRYFPGRRVSSRSTYAPGATCGNRKTWVPPTRLMRRSCASCPRLRSSTMTFPAFTVERERL